MAQAVCLSHVETTMRYTTSVRSARPPSTGNEHLCVGCGRFFESAYTHHFAGPDNRSLHERVSTIMDLGHTHEIMQANRILDLLREKPVRIIGHDTAEFRKRAPTIAFASEKWRPAELADRIGQAKVGIGGDNFYAYRLMAALGIPPEEGVVRVSLVQYTSADSGREFRDPPHAAVGSRPIGSDSARM